MGLFFNFLTKNGMKMFKVYLSGLVIKKVFLRKLLGFGGIFENMVIFRRFQRIEGNIECC